MRLVNPFSLAIFSKHPSIIQFLFLEILAIPERDSTSVFQIFLWKNRAASRFLGLESIALVFACVTRVLRMNMTNVTALLPEGYLDEEEEIVGSTAEENTKRTIKLIF